MILNDAVVVEGIFYGGQDFDEFSEVEGVIRPNGLAVIAERPAA